MERLKTNIVGPDGPPSAKMCFVGQAPGAEEDESGKPFVGDAGRLFNQGLRNAEILRQDVLVHNVFKQRPPKNDVSYYFSDSKNTVPTWEGQEHIDGLQRWLSKLLKRREMGLGGPNVICALGREAMMVLTGKKRITKWRGSVLPCTLVEGFKVYPSFHPSYVNRLMNEQRERLLGENKKMQQNVWPLFLRDLDRVKTQSEFPEILSTEAG